MEARARTPVVGERLGVAAAAPYNPVPVGRKARGKGTEMKIVNLPMNDAQLRWGLRGAKGGAWNVLLVIGRRGIGLG